MSHSRLRVFAFGLALFVVGVAAALAQLPSIPFSTAPYTHNMTIGECIYSGNFCVHVQQWGAYAIDTTKSSWTTSGGMVSPVENQNPGFQPQALTRCGGDFHQSAQSAAASAVTAKWVVTTINSLGSHFGCRPEVEGPYKVQVYSLASGGLQYSGQAFVDSQGSGNVIVGDTAYIDLGNGSWTPVNLPSCSSTGCTVGSNVSSLPPNTPQTSIGGFTYSIQVSSPQSFTAVRAGAPSNAPPVASATMTNLSAASRQGAEKTKNYFGDKWQIQDASVAFPAEDGIQWDIKLPGGSAASFSPDAAWSGALPNAALSTINPAYWPCDPASGGNLATGAGCYASLGSPASNYYLGLVTHNTCSTCGYSTTFVSPAQSLLAPQVSIAGFDGTTLRVLSGGSADASGSQGNIAEATSTWTFTPGGVLSGSIVTVPANAATFSLTATYRGGYSTTQSGAVTQVDLVPNFSLSPNPVLVSGTLTLTNLMQKGSSTTLGSVDYAVTTSSTPPGTRRVVSERRPHGDADGPRQRRQLLRSSALQLLRAARRRPDVDCDTALFRDDLRTEPGAGGLPGPGQDPARVVLQLIPAHDGDDLLPLR
jgi:hypothetical protein